MPEQVGMECVLIYYHLTLFRNLKQIKSLCLNMWGLSVQKVNKTIEHTKKKTSCFLRGKSNMTRSSEGLTKKG